LKLLDRIAGRVENEPGFEPLHVLPLDKAHGKAAVEMAHHPRHHGGKRKHAADLRYRLRRDRGTRSRQVENETFLRTSIGKNDPRTRILRHEARIGALVGNVEILELLEPVDLGGELAALFVGGDDAHDKAALEQADDRALELAEMIDAGEGALAQ